MAVDQIDANPWPVAGVGHDVARARLLQEKDAKEAARRKRLATIAADPDRAIADIEKLVEERSTDSYAKAAAALADVREVLGPSLGQRKPRRWPRDCGVRSHVAICSFTPCGSTDCWEKRWGRKLPGTKS